MHKRMGIRNDLMAAIRLYRPRTFALPPFSCCSTGRSVGCASAHLSSQPMNSPQTHSPHVLRLTFFQHTNILLPHLYLYCHRAYKGSSYETPADCSKHLLPLPLPPRR